MIRFMNSFIVMLLNASEEHAQKSSQLLFDKDNTFLENNDYVDEMNMYRQLEDG